MKLSRLLHSLFLTLCAVLLQPAAFAQGDAKAGQYIAKAGGCVGCHTDTKTGSVPFAGGRALETPFGTFFGPNITPDKQAGIGKWTEADFKRLKPQMQRVGDVKTFSNFIVPVPQGVDLAKFNTVIVWCETFSEFITAAQYQ